MRILLLSAICVWFFVVNSFAQETKFDFVLYTNHDGFRLESCIPMEMYSPRLIIPGEKRKVVQADVNTPPIQVIGSSWVNDCLIVEYTDSELPDEDWIDLITLFTVLSKEQINLIHKKQ